MSTIDPGAPFAVQDLNQVKTTLDAITVSSNAVAKSLASAFTGAAVQGKSFNDTLTTIAASLSKTLTKAAAQPVQQGLAMLLQGAFANDASVQPFADGGIVSSPTYFGANGGVGLMGEAGAEAIMPLARGPDGKLGLAGGGGQGGAAQINVSIATPDASSFRRSEAQVAGALARAVARGRRSL